MNEPLVWQTELERMGIACDPFWAHPDPFEGNHYHTYIEKHPEFSLGVRKTVANMLVAAQEELPSSWRIVLRAGYRPPSVQKAIFDALYDETARHHPAWSADQIHDYTQTYVTDPSTMSPHYTGGAVDVDARYGESTTLVDFGTTINTASPKSHLDTSEISTEQQANRTLLHDAMMSVGFAPFTSEWWHFQYGEKRWADYYGHDSLIYDIIDTI